MAIVTETGANAGWCWACSACSFNSLSSSDIRSFPHDFNDHPLVPLTIEFGVENSLPCAQIQPAGRNGYDHFVMDQERLQMRIAVIFAGIVMLVLLAKWRQVLQPVVDVFDQSTLVIVHIYARCNVHSRDEDHSFLHAALVNDLLDLRRDVNVCPMRLRVKLQVLSKRLHGYEVSVNARLQIFCRRRSLLRPVRDPYT